MTPASRRPARGERPVGDMREREQHDAVADVSDHDPEHQRQEERHQQRRIEGAGARKVQEADERLEWLCRPRVAHEQRRLRIARRGRQVLDEDRRAEAGVELACQPRQVAPGNPALGDERALRRAQPLDGLEPLELAGDRGAQGAEASGVREQERLALGPYGGDGLRELRQAALHRLDGRAEREALERLGQRGLANLCPAEQGSHGAPVAVTEHDHAADAAAVDARPDQMQAIAQLLCELLAKRLDHLLVVRVEDECEGAQPQHAELLVVEVGEFWRERQEPLERLQIPRKHQALVPERVQAPGQGLDPGRQALQLGIHLTGIQWARRRGLVVGSGVGRDRGQQVVGPRR